MLRIAVKNEKQDLQLEHAAGPLEFGRSPQQRPGAARCSIDDGWVSRDHLQVEELPAGRVRLRNISSRAPIDLGDGSSIAVGETRELPLPVRVTIGQTAITLAPPTPAAATKTAAAPPVSPPAPPPSSADRPPEGLDTLPPPMSPEAFAADGFVSIRQPVKA